MAERYDTVVVGAGIQGSSASYYITRSGVQNVLLLEQVHRFTDGIRIAELRQRECVVVADFVFSASVLISLKEITHGEARMDTLVSPELLIKSHSM